MLYKGDRYELETVNVCLPDSYVAINIDSDSVESYILSSKTVMSRYKFTGENWYNEMFDIMEPTGKVEGVVWRGISLTFEAPWGGTMPLEAGDMLVNSNVGCGPLELNVYRIAKAEFEKTYEEL